MDYVSGKDATIDKPAEYDFWKAYVPNMKPAWPGRLLSWQMSEPISLRERKVSFDPTGPGKSGMNLWLYRRLADQKSPQTGEPGPGDLSLVNWPQNDYWLGNLIDVAPEEASKHLQRAKQLSLSLLYWMQTERRDPEQGNGL